MDLFLVGCWWSLPLNPAETNLELSIDIGDAAACRSDSIVQRILLEESYFAAPRTEEAKNTSAAETTRERKGNLLAIFVNYVIDRFAKKAPHYTLHITRGWFY